MKKWISPKRNWKGIQFESLRRNVDPKFNDVHDALSKAFYEEKPFIWRGHDWGILSKEQFGKLHGLIFHLRTVEFHRANMAQVAKDRIPESEYNFITDENDHVVGKHAEEAARVIAKLRKEGSQLEV